MKMKELYKVQHEYLRKQLNMTLNSIIRTNSSTLLDKLENYGLIKLYFRSLELYTKSTVKVAISSLKNTLYKLYKNRSL
jgi:hypothetical protein